MAVTLAAEFFDASSPPSATSSCPSVSSTSRDRGAGSRNGATAIWSVPADGPVVVLDDVDGGDELLEPPPQPAATATMRSAGASAARREWGTAVRYANRAVRLTRPLPHRFGVTKRAHAQVGDWHGAGGAVLLAGSVAWYGSDCPRMDGGLVGGRPAVAPPVLEHEP